MKIKYLLIGTLAVLIAVGAAYAETKATVSRRAFIKIALLGQSVYSCVDSGINCDQYGALVCKIDVQTLTGIVTVNARDNQICVSTLNNNTNISAGTYSPIGGIIIGAQ